MERRDFGRRSWLGGAAAFGLGVLSAESAHAGERSGLVAKPPKGFVPLSIPGKVVRVEKADTLQPNELWPKQEAATAMLQRVMEELTGKSDVGEAFAKFVHKDDKVAIKPNGIAGRKGATMAANKELVLAIAKGVIAAGVPASNIMIYEQYGNFLKGTRVVDNALKLDAEFPAGIQTAIHEGRPPHRAAHRLRLARHREEPAQRRRAHRSAQSADRGPAQAPRRADHRRGRGRVQMGVAW